jgi:hypothetical protein
MHEDLNIQYPASVYCLLQKESETYSCSLTLTSTSTVTLYFYVLSRSLRSHRPSESTWRKVQISDKYPQEALLRLASHSSPPTSYLLCQLDQPYPLIRPHQHLLFKAITTLLSTPLYQTSHSAQVHRGFRRWRSHWVNCIGRVPIFIDWSRKCTKIE